MDRRARSMHVFALLTVLLPTLSNRCSAASPASVSAGSSLAELIREHQADKESVERFYSLPASTLRLDRFEGLQKRWIDRLKTVDFARLDQPSKLDFVLLRNKLEQSLANNARQRKRLAEIERWLAFGGAILELEQARWKASPLDFAATASKLEALAKQAKQLREQAEKASKSKPAGDKAPLSPAIALRTAREVAEFQETLKRWNAAYAGSLPGFEWWLKRPYEEAGKELEAYAKFLREEVAGQKGKDDDPLVGDPIGPEAVATDIRFEFLPYTADELIAIGERELAWCEQQMKAASRQMNLGDDWKAALTKVKTDYAPPGQQDELIARIGREATEFVRAKKLVVVSPLCEETWRLTMMSTEQMKTIPYAAYGGQQMLVAYARESMTQDDKLAVMRGNNRHFMRLVTPHELIPGHHLQAFHGARFNTHRQEFWTPFYAEGWALYWELRLWDLDWAKTPEDRIGMLFWRMTRAARIIVSLKYHLGRMSPPEMVDFLMNRVGHERLGATSEVRRFIQAAPLYQTGYLLGGLQLRSLQKELVGQRKMTEEQFHDAVLKANMMPIELLRASLLDLPLSAEQKPSWRFAGQLVRP